MHLSKGAYAFPGGFYRQWFCLILFLIWANATVTANASGAAPQISLSSPTNGAIFKSDRVVNLAVRVDGPRGKVRRVDFYDGTNLIASSFDHEFDAIWTNTTQGNHTISAVAADQRGDTFESAPVEISVVAANDNFSDATLLKGTNVSVAGGTFGATLENGEPDWNFGGGSVWYKWTAPSMGRVHLSIPSMQNMPNWAYFGVYTGGNVTNLTLVKDNRTSWGGLYLDYFFEVQPGTTYSIVVAGSGGPINPFTLDLQFWPKPSNDNFANRTVIPPWGGSSAADNTYATFEPGEPSGLAGYVVGYTASFRTVWWTWTAPVAGQVNIQPACDFQYLLGLYFGTSVSNLVMVASSFNGGKILDVGAGTTLQISVDGLSGQAGIVDLKLVFTPRPPNDDFKNAETITGYNPTIQGDNTAATSEPGEPLYIGTGEGRSVWWKWVAPVSGYVTINPATNSVTPVVLVYTGNNVSNMTLVVSSVTGPPAFEAVAGTEYHISVDGSYGWEGPFTLNLFESTIRLTRPVPDALYYAGDSITLAASTTALDGNGTEVDFFANGQLLGSAPRSSATIKWTNADLGTYNLTATTTDSHGVTHGSQPVTIHVRPANDDFTNAFVLQGFSVTTNGTNLGASKEPGEPTGGDPAADASVWYTWTAPASGSVVVSIGENYFAGHPIGVYTGDSVSNLVSLGESIYNFAPVNFVAHQGTTYHIEVNGYSGSPPDGAGPFALSVVQTPAPLNDDFTNAIVLSGNSNTVTGSNIGATSEPGEPEQSYSDLGNSIWWEWTAPADGMLTLSTAGSSFNPVVSLYTGNTLTNLTLYYRAYMDFISYNPTVQIPVLAGTPYHIAIVGFWYPDIAGPVVMNLNFGAAPANDDFENRLVLTGSPVVTSGSNTTAYIQPGETNSNGHTVWWSWTATNTGPVTIGKGGSSFTPLISIYTGTTIPNLVLVTNHFGDVTFNAIAGTDYAISMDSDPAGDTGQIELTLVAGPPANDNFNDRIALSGTNLSLVACTVGATEEAGEPLHGSAQGSNSVWWSWTAPATGTLNVNITGDGFSPTWTVYTGGQMLTSLHPLGDSYNWPWGPNPSGQIAVQGGVTYQIVVDGSPQYGAVTAGIVRVGLQFVGLPSNDNFVNRIQLGGTSIHVTGDTSGATREPGEPNHAGYAGGHSIWWTWTAPTSGHVTLDAFGSALTTLAAVYTGDTVSSLTNVASGNATYAAIDFDCDAGVAYQIAVDYWYPNMFGAVDLNLLFSSLKLTSLTNDEVFHGPAALLLNASSTVWDGVFDQMDFLADGNVIGSVTNGPYTFTWFNPPLGDHTMQVRITDSTGVTRFSSAVVIHIRPVNDDFADRIAISGDSAVVYASGIDATLEPGEPVHGPVNWESVWWTWTATTNGQVTLSKPSDLTYGYVLVDVYTGSALTNLTLVTNLPANGSGTLASSFTFEAQQGTAYQIAVAGSFFNLGDVPITLFFAPDLGGDSNNQPAASAIITVSQPVLSQGERTSATQFRFVLKGTPGVTYSIMASTNLYAAATNWTTILTTNVLNGGTTIEDNNATDGQRFYRAKVGP